MFYVSAYSEGVYMVTVIGEKKTEKLLKAPIANHIHFLRDSTYKCCLFYLFSINSVFIVIFLIFFGCLPVKNQKNEIFTFSYRNLFIGAGIDPYAKSGEHV